MTWRLRTVRTRVTVVAGLALTAAVLLGLVILYLLQAQSARHTIDGQLRTYAVQIADSAQAGAWRRPLPASTLDPSASAQVLAADGSVLAASRTLTGLPAVYALPAGSDTPVRQRAADGVLPGEVRVVAVRATVAGRPVTIVAETATAQLSQVSETFARLVVFGVPAILMLAAATVWLVTGRALHPVERIRRAVTDITAADLSRRVPEPGTADEIGSLAVTMNDMLARLEDAASRQRRFVADASHELRSPLAAIRTTLEVGLAHPDQAPWTDIARRAVRQSARLEALIGQLLLLAKSDDRQLMAGRGPVALGSLLAEVRATTVADGVDVYVAARGEIVVDGNPEHLSRLFRNVMDNAVRYAASRVIIEVRTEDSQAQVEISDDGPGIPAAERERVFDRFARLDSSRELVSGSTGLGLAIAKEIAVAHGGRIVADEATGGGARIVITLPLAPNEVASST